MSLTPPKTTQHLHQLRGLVTGETPPPPIAKLAIAWVEAHGLAGQHVRGEGPILMFAPLVSALRELVGRLEPERLGVRVVGVLV